MIGAIGLLSLGAFKLGAPDVFAGPAWPNVKAYQPRYIEVTNGTWHAPSWWRTVETVMPDALEMYLLPDPRWAHSMEQIKGQVTGFGMDWPPNHQWWGKKAYWFPWKNMVLWGMGLPLGIAATIGWAAAGFALWRGDRRHLLPWLFATLYFGFYGIQWAKSIRYVFPIYPALIVLAAWLLIALLDKSTNAGMGRERSREDRIASGRFGGLSAMIGSRRLALGALAVVVAGTALWGVMFTRIYTQDHSRVAGSEWIYHNLPTAFGARVVEGQNDDIRGPWLPASMAPTMQTEGFAYRFENDLWIGPMRLHVPGGPVISVVPEEPEDTAGVILPDVTVDAVRLAYSSDPAADPDQERIDVTIATSAFLDDGGQPTDVLGLGGLNVDVEHEENHLIVPLDVQLPLQPGSEYYLWVRVQGAPLVTRPAVLAYETQWDDIVPLGTREYSDTTTALPPMPKVYSG